MNPAHTPQGSPDSVWSAATMSLAAVIFAAVVPLLGGVPPHAPIPPDPGRTVAAPVDAERARVDTLLARFGRQTGIAARYLDHEEEILAGRDRLPEGRPRLALALDVLEDALLELPDGARHRLIAVIQLRDTLWDGDEEWAGWADCREGAITIALDRATDPGAIRTAFHHELGHLVYCVPGKFSARWAALGGHTNIEPALHLRTRPSPDFRAKGFVTWYGASRPNEDFAEFVEMHYTAPERLDRLARANAAVYHKRTMMHWHLEAVGVWKP